MAIIFQVGLLFLAVFVVVLVPEYKSGPEFVARKKIYLPQKELEHKVALAKFQNAVSSPMQMERILIVFDNSSIVLNKAREAGVST